MNTNFVNQLKSLKIDKSKKWMVNFAIAMIREEKKFMNNPDRNITKTNIILNNYYNQHYKQYYTKLYQNKSPKEKKEYIKNTLKNNKSTYNKDLNTRMRKITKLFDEGKLSKKSTKFIEDGLRD